MLFSFYDETPEHKASFIKLANENYWDSLTFNRVIENFVIQGGCPDTPDGFTDSPYLLQPEFHDSLKHIYGAVGMGRDNNPEKLSAGCQFYMVQARNGLPRLDGEYMIFGQVFKGFDVLDAIAAVETDSQNKPISDLILDINILSLTEEEFNKPKVQVVQNDKEQRVDILVDGEEFTSYLYTDTIPDLKKPVLFPIYSAKGSVITRGYPLETRPGERTDHPHHIGMWLNYGDVNNIDFWGYSNATPLDNRDRMGTIRHSKLKNVKSGKGRGSMEVEMEWLNSENHCLLNENTKFVFQAGENYRIIDRVTTLTANKEKVVFEDTKEGMMAIRVNRALELPSDSPVVLSDDHGNKTEVAKLDNTGVTGKYLNSEGISGLDVWGERAGWVSLSGKIDGEDISVIIFDHPGNVGSPSFWHARGYGLFAINPLGQKTFTKGEQELNLSLAPGQSVTFKYRVLIQSGSISSDEINAQYDKYIKN